MEPAIFLGIGVGFISGVDDASGGRGGGRRFFMNMLSPLGNEKLRPSRDLEDFAGARKHLSGDEERDQLFRHFPKVDVPPHQEVFVASIGIAERVGVVF